MSTFIFQKDTVLRGFLFNFAEQRSLIEQGDATILAQPNEQARIEAITSAKPIYQIDTIKPGAKVRYCAQSLWQNTTLQNLRVTVSIDFPLGTDLEEEQRKLEEQAQLKKRQHAKSVTDYVKDNSGLYNEDRDDY